MTGFTNQEKADLHFMYDVADGNALEAPKLYRESFCTRCLSDEKNLQTIVHQCLWETGSFVSDMPEQDTGHGI